VARGRRRAIVPLLARCEALQSRQPQFPYHVVRNLHPQQLKLAPPDCTPIVSSKADDALLAAIKQRCLCRGGVHCHG